MSTLKPCPFCGGKGERGAVLHSGKHYILCDVNDCGMSTTNAHEDESEAIAEWNTRSLEADMLEALIHARNNIQWMQNHDTILSSQSFEYLDTAISRAEGKET